MLYAAIPGALLGLVTAAQGGDPSPLDFTTYGISGAVIAALVFGWLWPKPAVEKILASEARAQARAEALEATLKDEIVPVLRDVAKATGSGGPLERIAEKVDRIERRIDELRRPGGGSSP